MDGLPQDQSMVSFVLLLLITFTYAHTLLTGPSAKKRKSVGDSVLYFGDHVELSPEVIVPGVPHDPSVAGLTWFGLSGYRGLGEPLFTSTKNTNEDIQTNDTFSWVHGKHAVNLESD
jgi:hypothetical protein